MKGILKLSEAASMGYHALAVIAILMDRGWRVSLSDLMKQSLKLLKGKIEVPQKEAHHALAVLAGGPGRFLTAGEISKKISGSEAHLAKVMRRLVRARLISSTRGPGGGFKIAKPADEISLLDIYEAVEGKFEIADCMMDHPCCEENNCIMGSLIRSVNVEVYEFFRLGKEIC